ncbi:MAG: hypothetical protein JEZ11_04970 [Desulfobacterales bacterium]|nr:hypothetical protein [Desulfobacterales bacterium]
MMGNGSKGAVVDRMVLVGLGLGIVYWLIECVLIVFIKEQTSFVGNMFGPDLGGLSTRIIALCLFLIFGSHVQYTVAQKKELASERDELLAKNESLSRELAALKKA